MGGRTTADSGDRRIGIVEESHDIVEIKSDAQWAIGCSFTRKSSEKAMKTKPRL